MDLTEESLDELAGNIADVERDTQELRGALPHVADALDIIAGVLADMIGHLEVTPSMTDDLATLQAIARELRRA